MTHFQFYKGITGFLRIKISTICHTVIALGHSKATANVKNLIYQKNSILFLAPQKFGSKAVISDPSRVSSEASTAASIAKKFLLH